jgi:hypothetical protein
MMFWGDTYYRIILFSNRMLHRISPAALAVHSTTAHLWVDASSTGRLLGRLRRANSAIGTILWWFHSASRDLAASLRLEYLGWGPGSTGGGAAAGPPVPTFFPSFYLIPFR